MAGEVQKSKNRMKGDGMKGMARLTIFVLIMVLIIGAAYAQFAKPEEAIKYRKAVMYLVLQHFKPMGAVVKGKAAYDKDAFSANADAVAKLATLPWQAFMVPGSDKGNTKMKSAVFDKPDQFKKAAASFESETAMLAKTAMGGDLDSIKAQFVQVAQRCDACHKQFTKN